MSANTAGPKKAIVEGVVGATLCSSARVGSAMTLGSTFTASPWAAAIVMPWAAAWRMISLFSSLTMSCIASRASPSLSGSTWFQ